MTVKYNEKILAIIMSVILCIGLMGLNISAVSDETISKTLISETVEYSEDGSSITISVYEDSAPMTRATTYSKSGSKTYTARNSDGDIQWKFTVQGVFSVTEGSSSSCTSSKYSSEIVDDAWSLKTASASKSGNKAIGDATYQRKVLFITTSTENPHIELKCDTYGNLS